MKSFRVRFAHVGVVIALVFASSGCVLPGQRDGESTDTPPTQDSPIFAMINSVQVATVAPADAYFSQITTHVLLGSQDSTFADDIQKTPSCMFELQDGISFKRMGYSDFDIGTLQLLGGGLTEPLDFGKTDQQYAVPNMYYLVGTRVPAGTYDLKNSQSPIALDLSQSLTVPANGSDIKLTSGEGAAQSLASPAVPAETDPNYVITIQKTQKLKIEFTAPAGIDYVRFAFNDGSYDANARPYSSVVCYGLPDQPLVIGEGWFKYFRSTDDAFMSIDFVRAQISTEIPKIKESLILSAVRHTQGYVEYVDDEGSHPLRFGKLRFE